MNTYRLTATDGGRLPEGYPLQIGSVLRRLGSLPEAVWNDADRDWVGLIWTPCPDPSEVPA